MVTSSIRHGLWYVLLAASIAIGVSACGGTDDPAEDEEAVVKDVTDDSAATEEDVAEAEQAVCSGYYPGAPCFALCCSHQNWNNLGPMGWGTCENAGQAHCANAGGLCGACWGY